MIQFYIILDCVDGELARIKGLQSVGGKKLEQFTHAIFDNLCIVGVTVGSFQQTGYQICWWLGIALFLGMNMKNQIEYIIRTSLKLEQEDISKSQISDEHLKAKQSYIRFLISKIISLPAYIEYKGLHIIVILGCFGQMHVALLIWTLIMNLRWIQKAIYWIRNIEQTNRTTMLVLPSELFEKIQAQAHKNNSFVNQYILHLLEQNIEQLP